MARGTAANEPIVSQAQTKEYDEGYDRVFGSDRKPQRGRWVWDSKQQKLVSADEYQPEPEQAINAPILSGRFYENTAATDGTDIGSRAKHREYMHRNGLTTSSDYTKVWEKAAKTRAEFYQNGGDAKETSQRREQVERAYQKVVKP